jgi:hypothetical protein
MHYFTHLAKPLRGVVRGLVLFVWLDRRPVTAHRRCKVKLSGSAPAGGVYVPSAHPACCSADPWHLVRILIKFKTLCVSLVRRQCVMEMHGWDEVRSTRS